MEIIRFLTRSILLPLGIVGGLGVPCARLCAQNAQPAAARDASRSWTLAPMAGTLDAPRRLQGVLLRTVGLDTPLTKRYAVLKLDDGQERGYPLERFSADDRAYVQAKMPTPPPVEATASADDEYKSQWTDYDPVKDKDAVSTHATEHFLFFWGHDITPEAKNWGDESFRSRNFRYFEQVWDFFASQLHAPMPYQGQAQKYKTNVYITGTGLSKHKEGFAFGGINIVMHPGALLEGSTVVPHEFMHTLQLHSGGFRDSPDVGWFWECHANWGSQEFAPSYPPALEVFAPRMHLELESSRMNYGSWPFLKYLAENPRFGPQFCFDIWTQSRRNAQGAATETPFQSIMRLGAQRKLFAGDGVQGFGDVVGEAAAHNATWDYINQETYENYLSSIFRNWRRPSGERAVLRPVADRPGWFKPLYSQAPRQYGANIIDLVLQPAARAVSVNLEGIADETEGSDWRATIVAVNEDKSHRALQLKSKAPR